MKVYRLALARYSDLSGEGARLYGGRWNRPGTPVVYASSSVALVLLERLTVDAELLTSDRYRRYVITEITIDEEQMTFFAPDQLPAGWDAVPCESVSQYFGEGLIEKGILGFAVPSVVDFSSYNFVLNPLAKDFHDLRHESYPLSLDERLIRR